MTQIIAHQQSSGKIIFAVAQSVRLPGTDNLTDVLRIRTIKAYFTVQGAL